MSDKTRLPFEKKKQAMRYRFTTQTTQVTRNLPIH